VKPESAVPRALRRVLVLCEEGEGLKSVQCAGKRRDGQTRRDIEGGTVSAGDGMREERKI
jgi:hypothetical protein